MFPSGAEILLVAEIGNNHEGDIRRAMDLVRAAAASGAGAVKFQTFRTELFIRPKDAARFRMLKKFELSPDDFSDLADLARSLGLLFFSTPLDLESAAMLEPLVDAYKIASGDITFTPLIRRVAATGKPVIFSTGASTMEEIHEAVDVFRPAALLHCVSSYPAPAEQVNLSTISALKEYFPDIAIGYSDHTIGIESCLVAAAVGARVIEKHFTLDKAFSDFPDHKLSADPADLAELSERLRLIRAMLGTPGKAVQPCEASMPPLIRRSIALKTARKKGDRIEESDLVWLRPGTGLRPGMEHEAVGKTLRRDYESGEILDASDLI